MSRGIVRAPGVNLLRPDGSSRRIRTLDTGAVVDVRGGSRWLRVEFEGEAGIVPAAAIDLLEPVAPAPPAEDDLAWLRPEPAPGGSPIRRFSEGTRFVGEPIDAHLDFHAALRRLDAYAGLAGVKLFVLHSFRRWHGGLSAGRAVPLAQRSNHLVGHAVDVHVVAPGIRLDAARLRRERAHEWPAGARDLVRQIRADGLLRWGGDLLRPDPVHIDDDLYGRDPERWWTKLESI